jgi:two-component system response regulator AtoC
MAGNELPKLLIVEDDPQLRKLLLRTLSSEGRKVSSASSGQEAKEAIPAEDPDVMLLDLGLPDMSGLEVLKAALHSRPGRAVVILTSQADEESVVEAMRLGALDYLTKDTSLEDLEIKMASAFAVAGQNAAALQEKAPQAQGDSKGILVGRSPAMVEVFKQIGILAPSSVPVLITGESGTGKEKVARALHAYGPRPNGPFVAVDCASLPANLMESELFGYEKGAFTGAQNSKRGRFEEADGGTLFLDEVGNLPMEVSAKLLRALQEKTTQRLGGNRSQSWDARIVAAANVDLWAKAKRGEFREDLVFRLAGAEIKLPPLRQRPGDVDVLVRHFIGKSERPDQAMSQEFLGLLKAYPWPGNVRELEHALQRAMAGARGQALRPEHLPEAILGASPLARAGVRPASRMEDLAPLEDIKRQYASYAVETCGGNRTEAAKRLGIDRRTLNSLLGEAE